MPNITGLPPETLRSMTGAQILSAISDFFSPQTKRQLILWLLDVDRVPDNQVCTYRPDGQIERIIDVERDAETGVTVGGKVATFNYFVTSEIKVIVISYRDADNNEIGRRTITHFRDGRQPVVETVGQVAGTVKKKTS